MMRDVVRWGLAVLLGAGAALMQPMDVHAQSARPSTVQAYPLADSVRVGERFELVVRAQVGFGATVHFPDTADASFGEPVVLARSAGGRAYGGRQQPGVRIDSARYTLATFALDAARVPRLPVRIIANGDTTTRYTEAVTVPVRRTVGPNERNLRGMTGPAAFPRPLWPWALLALGVVAVAGGLWYHWQRTSTPPTRRAVAAPSRSRTPYERALQRLHQLEAAYPADIAADTVDGFYDELAALIRTYVAQRLAVRTRERTTREVVDALQAHPEVPRRAALRLRAVLELSDLVKFAGAQPSAHDHETALQETRAALSGVESRTQSVDASTSVSPKPSSAHD